MIESLIRVQYQRLLVDPWLGRLAAWHPSFLTLLSLLLGLLVPVALTYQYVLLALGLMWLSGYIDTLDGSLARLVRCSSAIGATLDICADRCVEFAIMFGILLVCPAERAVGVASMLIATGFCVTTFLCVGIFTPKTGVKSFYYSPGIIERFEAFVLFSLIIAFPGRFSPLCILYCFLTLLTGFIRLYQFVKNQ